MATRPIQFTGMEERHTPKSERLLSGWQFDTGGGRKGIRRCFRTADRATTASLAKSLTRHLLQGQCRLVAFTRRLNRRSNEVVEEWMRLCRAGFELWMKLKSQHPRMVSKLNNLD